MVAFRDGVTDDSADDTDGGDGGPDGGGEARRLVMGAVAVRAINSTIEPGYKITQECYHFDNEGRIW